MNLFFSHEDQGLDSRTHITIWVSLQKFVTSVSSWAEKEGSLGLSGFQPDQEKSRGRLLQKDWRMRRRLGTLSVLP